MKIGVVGMFMTGKTTIFHLLLGEDPAKMEHISHGKVDGHSRIVNVHDSRLWALSEIYQPKKTTPATLELIDTPALDPKSPKERNRVFGVLQGVDALLWIVGIFDEAVLTPLEQLDQIQTEIILRDLEIIENRLARLQDSKRKLEKREEIEIPVLKKIKEALESSSFPVEIYHQLDEENRKALGSYSLLSVMPQLVVMNMGESEYDHKDRILDTLQPFLDKHALDAMVICGKLEMEINALEENEKRHFLSDLGLKETSIQRLTAEIYKIAGLISFFTVGQDEVRAWTITRGTNAKQSAGKIHSDLERGFIRADIMKNEDLITLGNEKTLKDKGLVKTVGKEHIIEDGDVVHIRFNV